MLADDWDFERPVDIAEAAKALEVILRHAKLEHVLPFDSAMGFVKNRQSNAVLLSELFNAVRMSALHEQERAWKEAGLIVIPKPMDAEAERAAARAESKALMPSATQVAPPQYAGADWIRAALENQRGEPVALSPLGEQVADILGHMYRGIYHIEGAALHDRVEWQDRHCIRIVIGRELANVDGPELTDLVIGCANRGIRVAVSAAARGYLELVFTSPGAGMWFGRLRPLTFADHVPSETDAQPARPPGGAS